jgi:hypothetical protein
MNDAAPARVLAARLAAWSKLPRDSFFDAYASCAPRSAKDWKQLEADVALAGGEQAGLDALLIVAACIEAERHKFIDKLALSVSNIERSRQGRSETDIEALMKDFGPPGTMHAVNNRAAGLLEARLFGQLQTASDACAYVRQDKVIGTAFLVTPDLVLTSAHVVLSTGKDNNGGTVFQPTLKPKLLFGFAPERRDPAQMPIEVAASGDGPVAFAFPHGEPPNKLTRDLGPASAANLDFALVRLARQIRHVTALDISEPRDAELRKCFVLGYPGGNTLKFDADVITEVNRPGARLMHLASTVEGMSGGCCIGAQGIPVGLHEGGFERVEAGLTVFENNRAVCLTNIRNALRALPRDPLLAKPRSPGLVIPDRSLIPAWHEAGLRLAGKALEAEWRQAVANVLGAAPGDGDVDFHPWFQRKDLERWINEARDNSADRVLYVTGEQGTGKSFAKRILEEMLDDPARDLVVLSPTQTTAWSWTEAVRKLYPEKQRDRTYRTEPGATKHVDVPAIVEGLATYGRQDRTGIPLFVAIDFENGTELSLDATQWREFLLKLASEPWIRLMVVGLSPRERLTLDTMLTRQPDTETLVPQEIEMRHAGRKDIQDFIRNAYKNFGKTPKTEEINELLRLWEERPASRQTRTELHTCDAVMIALAIYKLLLRLPQQPPAAVGPAGGQA